MECMEAYNLTKVPTIPMIIQCVVPSTWHHPSHTRCKQIGGRPSYLNFLSTCPPSPSCITQAEIPSAPFSMSVDMPAWNSNIDPCCWIDLHLLRELGHVSAKILRPLTANVICNKNPWEYHASKIMKSILQYLKGTKNKLSNDFICNGHMYFLPFWRSPATFLCTSACQEQIMIPTPVTA